jgi:release factor glutamine methyltransferase
MSRYAESTIGEAWRSLVGQLSRMYGQQEATAIAREVFLRLLHIGPDQRVIRAGEGLDSKQLSSLEAALDLLKEGMPVQYITGVTSFLDMELVVSPGALIPRPETQELVLWAVSFIKNTYGDSCINILDVGTGSGCIALALAKMLNYAKVYACDISETALDIARRNAFNNKLDIHLFLCNVLEKDKGEAPLFDCVISNPPYVRFSEKTVMKPNVLAHEPELALFVEDDDPLKYYRAIANKALMWLQPDGLIFFEINEAFGAETVKLIREIGFTDVALKQDIHGKDRFVMGRK